MVVVDAGGMSCPVEVFSWPEHVTIIVSVHFHLQQVAQCLSSAPRDDRNLVSFLVPILFSLRVALRSPGKSEKSGRFSKHSGIAEGFLKNPKKRKIFRQKRKTWQVW